jgi:hypothetical protein
MTARQIVRRWWRSKRLTALLHEVEQMLATARRAR